MRTASCGILPRWRGCEYGMRAGRDEDAGLRQAAPAFGGRCYRRILAGLWQTRCEFSAVSPAVDRPA